MLYRITVLTLYLLLSVVSHAVAKDSALETQNKKYDTALELYSEKEYDKAIDIIDKELKKTEKDTVYHELTEKFLVLKARCQYRLSKTEQTIKTTCQYIDYHAKYIGTEDLTYACYLDNLSLYLLNTNETESAKQLNTLAADIIKKIDDKSPDLAVTYIHGADIYTQLQDYDKVIDLMNDALDIFEYNYGKHSERYIDELRFLQKTYERQNNDVKSMQLSGEITKLAKEAKEGYVPEDMDIKDSIMARDRKEDMRMCCTYYLNHDLKDEKMGNAGGFIMAWAAISDEMTVILSDITVSNLFCTIAYTAGYALNALQDLKNNNNRDNHVQGYIAMLNFYINNKNIVGNIDEYEEYIKLYDKDSDTFLKKLNEDYDNLLKQHETKNSDTQSSKIEIIEKR